MVLWRGRNANVLEAEQARGGGGGGGGADLVQQAGERARHVAFEGELAVLAGRPLGAGPLEEHAGHAVPVSGPDGVSLQGDVWGRLQGRLVSAERKQKRIGSD